MRLLSLACTAMLAGCSIEVPTLLDDDEGAAVQRGPALRGEGKLSNNGLHLAPELLAGLEALPLGEAAAALAATPEGTHHTGYLARCALDEGDALIVEGATKPGLYGLAPEWETGACDESCQRWVSACLLAHANAFGVEVAISLRGEHPGLVWDEDIVTDFSLQEAAFYGNVFDGDADSWNPPLYACAGTALVEFEHGFPRFAADPIAYLDSRICSLGFPCGLLQTGACHSPLDLPPTCDIDADEGGYYGDCRGPRAALGLVVAPAHPEIITTYLAPD